MTEDQLQITLVEYIKTKHPYLIFFHIPNGGSRHILEAKKLKKMGVMPGVADLFFLSLQAFLELKTKNGRLTDAQLQFREMCLNRGYSHYVTYGLDQAIKLVDKLANIYVCNNLKVDNYRELLNDIEIN